MIAVKNIYYLLLYAWDVFDEGTMASVDVEPDTDLLSLLSSVLVRGIDRLLRRGLDRGYLNVSEEIAGVRGKCDLSATIKANLLTRGRTVCQYDELSYDVLHNQILKATLRHLLSTELAPALRPRVRTAYLRLPHVHSIQLSRRTFKNVQLHRNIRSYRLLMDVCRLLYDHLIPIQGQGVYRFRDFTRDEVRMRKLFERFLFNFFKHEQSRFKVRRTRFRWANAEGQGVDLLPTMTTDVTLERPGHFLVMDAKYTPNALQQPLHGSPTLRSGHLYQLFAYLNNLPTPPDTRLDGIILYPLGAGAVDASVSLSGHGLRACTIDLNQHWTLIRRDLLAVVPP
jgi:5-methylcytosine-specific restriction enzyme subunit McrC